MPSGTATRSEISATASKRFVISVVVEASASALSVMSRRLKSAGSPARRWWRSRRSWVICASASWIASGERAAARIWSTFTKRTGEGRSAASAAEGAGKTLAAPG